MKISFLVLLTVLIGLALGTIFAPFLSIFSIPIVLMFFVGFVLTTEGLSRHKRITQMKRFRQSARAQKADFTDQDKRTLV